MAMPRVINVALQQIAYTGHGFGGFVDVSGDLFGATFQNNPNDPNDQQDQREIFQFPDGPIRILAGTLIAVAAPARVAQFELFLPELDSPGDFPQFLSFGGTLKNDNLGTSFTTIRFDEALPFVAQPGEPQVPPLPFDVVYDNGTIRITLTFGLNVALVFSG